MRWFVTVGERELQVELGPEGVEVDGVPVSADLAHVEGTDLHSLIVDGTSHRILATRSYGERWEIHVHGRRWQVDAVDERTRALREMAAASGLNEGPRPIRAPMPGLVVKVEVAVGDTIAVGQGLVIVEAMKMENELRAEAPGVVAHIHVAPGQAVEKDQILIDLHAPAAEEEGTS